MKSDNKSATIHFVKLARANWRGEKIEIVNEASLLWSI